jgi:ankyrin repeat protein
MTLFEAVARGDVAQVQALLEEKPDVNVLGADGRTPLIEAASQGNLELVQRLLEAGAYPDLKDAMSETALLKAAANGHLAVAKLLGPLADDEERAMANAFLRTAGVTAGPVDLQTEDTGFKRKAAELAARASELVGHTSPSERFARIERAEKNAKKK